GPGGRLSRFVGNIRERTERPGGEERITSAFEDAHGLGCIGAEGPNEGGLADTGFPRDQHQPTGSALALAEGLAESLEEGLALEKLARCDSAHESILRLARGRRKPLARRGTRFAARGGPAGGRRRVIRA